MVLLELIKDEIYVNEINTTPGSLAYYLFEEKILELLEKQIKTALLNFQNKKETVFQSSILVQNYSIKKWLCDIINLCWLLGGNNDV